MYLHEDNEDKPFVDWRDEGMRMEGFLRWLQWRIKYYDLDHYGPNNAYRDYYGMTKEQTYWFCTIFGMTYQSEMAWVIFWNFPDFEKIDLEELDSWNRRNMPIMKYAKDTKYNKGHIVSQVDSIKKIVEPFGSLTSFYESMIVEGDQQKTFESLYNAVVRFHKYGRMTVWITLQALYETANIPCNPNTMLAYDDSSWSVRSGLYYLYNRNDMLIDSKKAKKVSNHEAEWIKNKEIELYDICLSYLNDEQKVFFSNYLLESQLCQYKKLMIGGDYAGHSSGDHISRAYWLQERWPSVDFSPFFDNVMNKLYYHKVVDKEENKSLRDLTALTGQMINMDEDFPDMPDMYKELGITTEQVSNDSENLKLIRKKISDFNSAEINELEKFL